MKKIIIIMACLLLFFAVPAFADEIDDALPTMASEDVRANVRQLVHYGMNSDDIITFTRAMIQNRFRQENTLEAQRIVMKTFQEGLPVGPVMNKAYEGMAKQIVDRNIVRAMETVRIRYSYSYGQARKITRDRSQVVELGGVIAGGLAAGIQRRDADAIMNSLRERTRDMKQNQSCLLAIATFEAVRDMSRLGAGSQEATEVVCQALRHRFSTQEMIQVKNSFVKHVQFSKPDLLAGTFAEKIGRGEHVGNLGSSDKSMSAGTGKGGSHDGSGHADSEKGGGKN